MKRTRRPAHIHEHNLTKEMLKAVKDHFTRKPKVGLLQTLVKGKASGDCTLIFMESPPLTTVRNKLNLRLDGKKWLGEFHFEGKNN